MYQGSQEQPKSKTKAKIEISLKMKKNQPNRTVSGLKIKKTLKKLEPQNGRNSHSKRSIKFIFGGKIVKSVQYKNQTNRTSRTVPNLDIQKKTDKLNLLFV